MNLLQINSGIFGQDSQSTALADRFVSLWRDHHPEGQVVVRDLASDPVPHLDGFRFGAFLAEAEQRSSEQSAVVAFSDQLIEELKNADTIVIGLPMYNFSVPSTLKAWFDHIARAGITFKYTETGPVGLLDGAKKVRIVAARGGIYQGTPKDTQTDYVRMFLGFLGLTDVQFIYAEGLSMGARVKKKPCREPWNKWPPCFDLSFFHNDYSNVLAASQLIHYLRRLHSLRFFITIIAL